MDFFQAQDAARRRSKLLVFYFLAAVASIIAVIYVVAILGLRVPDQGLEPTPMRWWRPDVLAIVAIGTIGLIGLGSFFKTVGLRAGGSAVARSVGGQRVDPNTTKPDERRLFNIVEEMAIASGVRVPEVFILPEEGINAFAAGWSPDDAAVAVTRGAMETLSRDELQGVIAHEFSHILNGDMRLNIRLIGLLFGILLLAIIGRGALYSLHFSRGGGRRDRNSGGIIAAIVVIGLTLMVVGYVGVLFGRLIQAAVSRQREFLADASAVQFTRNPSGIGGALKKIGGLAAGARVRNTHAAETSHMFFANALQGSAFNLFATHPPLTERIRAIEPSFDGRFPVVRTGLPAVMHELAAEIGQRKRSTPPPLRPEQLITAIATAATIAEPGQGAAAIAEIPDELREAAHDPERVRAVVLALLATSDDAGTDQRQAAALGKVLTRTEIETGASTVPLTTRLSVAARLALLDLALPALRTLPAATLTEFLQTADAMVLADYQVTPFEFALQRIVQRHLRSAGRLPPATPAGNFTPKPLDEDVTALLSAMAQAGAKSLDAAGDAFSAGARAFGLCNERMGFTTRKSAALPQLTMSLERLDRISPSDKKRLLAALARTAAVDNAIAADEFALLRAFAAALDCPAPIVGAQPEAAASM